MMKKIIILLALVLAISSYTNAEVIQEAEDGLYNWEKSVVEAVGYGFAGENIRNETRARLLARESAISMAQRRLLEIIEGVQVDSEKVVKDAQLESDIVTTRVSGLIRGARIIDEESLPDNGYKVVMEVQFYGQGGIMEAIFPELEASRDSSRYREQSPEVSDDGIEIADYTGVIIDATAMDLEPALAPRIYTTDDRLVYGIDLINRDEVITNGLVGYSRTVADARNQGRIGNNPLIIDALEVRGEYKTDLLINEADAAKINRLDDRVFSRLAVIIVL